jgi:hypothetical protein
VNIGTLVPWTCKLCSVNMAGLLSVNVGTMFRERWAMFLERGGGVLWTWGILFCKHGNYVPLTWGCVSWTLGLCTVYVAFTCCSLVSYFMINYYPNKTGFEVWWEMFFSEVMLLVQKLVYSRKNKRYYPIKNNTIISMWYL